VPVIAGRQVPDAHHERPACVTGVPLLRFGQRPVTQIRYRQITEIVPVAEAGVKGKPHIVPHREVACGMAVLTELAALEIPVMSNVVNRRVSPAGLERRRARRISSPQ